MTSPTPSRPILHTCRPQTEKSVSSADDIHQELTGIGAFLSMSLPFKSRCLIISFDCLKRILLHRGVSPRRPNYPSGCHCETGSDRPEPFRFWGRPRIAVGRSIGEPLQETQFASGSAWHSRFDTFGGAAMCLYTASIPRRTLPRQSRPSAGAHLQTLS